MPPFPGKFPPFCGFLVCNYNVAPRNTQHQTWPLFIFWIFRPNVPFAPHPAPLFLINPLAVSLFFVCFFAILCVARRNRQLFILLKVKFFLDKRRLLLYFKANRKRTNTLTGKKSLLNVSESCRFGARQRGEEMTSLALEYLS